MRLWSRPNGVRASALRGIEKKKRFQKLTAECLLGSSEREARDPMREVKELLALWTFSDDHARVPGEGKRTKGRFQVTLLYCFFRALFFFSRNNRMSKRARAIYKTQAIRCTWWEGEENDSSTNTSWRWWSDCVAGELYVQPNSAENNSNNKIWPFIAQKQDCEEVIKTVPGIASNFWLTLSFSSFCRGKAHRTFHSVVLESSITRTHKQKYSPCRTAFVHGSTERDLSARHASEGNSGSLGSYHDLSRFSLKFTTPF